MSVKGSARAVADGVLHSLKRSEVLVGLARRNPKITRRIKDSAKRFLGPSITTSDTNTAPGYVLNPDMAVNYAEHTTLLNDNKVYWHEDEAAGYYQRSSGDPRVVAIYLPQFHPFRENDIAWGKGFTEWTNVTSSIPRFVGQQQPVLPSDLGFYDLRLASVMKQQIDLALKYGVYGFQFYYYWFSGKKVMDLPINTMLDNPEWNFNFSICWANENWTRKWDGGSNEIIFEQKNAKDDPLRFIEDVSPILNDKRYICEGDKPILTVYRVELLDDPARYVRVWRRYFKKKFKKDLWLIGHSYSSDINPLEFGFDATMDFAPIGSLQPTLKPWVDDRKYLTESFRQGRKLLDMRWMGQIIDFRFIAKQEIANLKNNHHFYRAVSPSWSNEARRKGNDGYTFFNSSPEIFVDWFDAILNDEINIRKKASPIVFVNAWNEWAEAAMLEPSMHLGHNSLLRIAETVSKYSNNKVNKLTFPTYGLSHSHEAKLAVVIHLFYPDMWQLFDEKLKRINVPFDLYVSVSGENSNISIDTVSTYHKNTNIIVVPNRGRDVLPFLMIMSRVVKLKQYEYILKLHSKKSKHRTDGDNWFVDVLEQLIPENPLSIINTLSLQSTGVVGPAGHVVSLSRHMGANKENIAKIVGLMTDEEYKKVIKDESTYPFFGSTMFWCRVDFISRLLDTHLMPSDFESEQGQIDGTLAHALERVFGGVLHKITNRRMYSVDRDGLILEIDDKMSYREKYEYAD